MPDYSFKFNGTEVKTNFQDGYGFGYKKESAEIQRVCSVFDTNHDGTLQKSEIKGAILHFMQLEKKVGNGDGNLDFYGEEGELLSKQFMKSTKSHVESALQKMTDAICPDEPTKQTLNNYRKRTGTELHAVSLTFEQIMIDMYSYGGQIIGMYLYGEKPAELLDSDNNIYQYNRYSKKIEKTNYYRNNGQIIESRENRSTVTKGGTTTVSNIDREGNGTQSKTTQLNKQGQKRYEKITYKGGNVQTVLIKALNNKGQTYVNEQYAAKVLGLKPETKKTGIIGFRKEEPTGRYNVERESTYEYDPLNGGFISQMCESISAPDKVTYLEWDEKKHGFVQKSVIKD